MKTAQEIADLLRAQAAGNNNVITLTDELVGTTGLDALAWNDLRRAPGNILLIVDPAAIPQSPPATGFTIPARVPAGEDAFLLLDGRDATLEFSINDAVTLLLTVKLRSSGQTAVSWTFSDSFPQLIGFPYDDLTIDAPALQISTGAPARPTPGLYFDGMLVLEGIFAMVAELTGASDSHALSGLFTTTPPEITFDLTADIGVPTLDLGGIVRIEDVGVGVGLTLFTRSEDGTVYLVSSTAPESDSSVERLIQMYFGGMVTFENSSGTQLPLEIRANLPLSGSSIGALLFSILPADGFTTTLDRLGSLIAGQTWDDFFTGEAASIKQYFETFGLLGYSTLFWPTSGKITNIGLSVGTDPDNPWPLWGDYTLALRADWNILFLGSDTLQTLTIKADFDFGTLQFEVEVRVPDLFISGTQTGGPLSYSLDDLNKDLFENQLPVPSGLLTVSIENFNIELHVPQEQVLLMGVVNATVAPFDTQLLAISNMAVAVTIDSSGATTQYTAQINGEVSLGPISVQADATISNAPGVETVFSMHLVDETVGSLLNYLIDLVDPSYNLDLGDPWNALLDIRLDALVLKVNLTRNIVELVYNEQLFDLGFMSIEQIGLRYQKGNATATSSVQIELEGTFLGQQFGAGRENPPLGWDAMNEAPPAVPGQGASLFDLQYIGLGQHIGFGPEVPVDTIAQIMSALQQSVIPKEAGQLPSFGKNGLEFKSQSDWLIGAQFSVMDTVAISAIFNDPDLYGILIQLSGEKAQVFDGLSFEILYRKVSDNLGVYHIELKLPDAMRNLQFGSVSLTLPVAVVDIYTNGNFHVDFGFPKGLDFSNSFSVQLFPFVGYGGFYFALLDDATSSRVPQITNGTFSPVIEFGVGLSIGVGKTVEAGILRGGMTVTVVGIVQGVLAWFNPTDASPKETYYWLQGTVSIVGQLYATVDFGIIKASVDVTAYASVTLTIEAHQPIYIAISARVSVRVKVKVGFFKIRLTFKTTIEASFTVGSVTPTPWRLGEPNSVSASPRLRALRGQRTLHSPIRRHAGMGRVLMKASLSADTALQWTPVLVLPAVETVTIWAVSAFTKADTFVIESIVRGGNVVTVTTGTAHDFLAGDTITIAAVADASFNGSFTVRTSPTAHSLTLEQSGPDASSTGGTITAGNTATRAVLMFAAETSAADGADSDEELETDSGEESQTDSGEEPQTDSGDDPAGIPFNLLMRAMLAWGIAAENGGVLPVAVTALQLADLDLQLQDPDVVATAFDYSTLSEFLAANFIFDVQPAGDTQLSNGVALFPMLPALSLTDSAGTDVDFWNQTRVDETYQKKVEEYFKLLQTQFEERQGDGGLKAAGEDGSVSMATIVFGKYFSMLMTQGVKAASDLLAQYPYTPTTDCSLATLARDIGDSGLASDPIRVILPNAELPILVSGSVLLLDTVVHQVRSGESFGKIAQTFADAGALNEEGQPYSAADLLAANLFAPDIFAAGEALPVNGIACVSNPYDTLRLIAMRFLVRADGNSLLNSLTGLSDSATTLLQANPDAMPADATAPVTTGTILQPGTVLLLPAGVATVLPPDGKYTTVPGDTFTLVAAYLLAAAGNSFDITAFTTANPSITDVNAALAAGTAINVPAITRVFNAGDSVATLADTLLTTTTVIQDAVLAADPTTALLAPLAVLHAPLQYTIQPEDTFSGIAAKFNLSLQDFEQPVLNATAPLFAENAALTVDSVETIAVDRLMSDLLEQGEWNNVAGMVSRFMLSGLRLPDPRDPTFEALTIDDLQDPRNLADIVTKPLFELTGQQYPITLPLPDDYTIAIANEQAESWIGIDPKTPLQFSLTANQQKQLEDVDGTTLDTTAKPERLALFQMVPPRTALQNQIPWQASVAPVITTSDETGSTPATGTPTVWLFPNALLKEITDAAAQNAAPLLYELVEGRHTDPNKPVTTSEVGCYAWGTIVDFTITLPVVEGSAPAIANAYVVGSADDAGAATLQALYEHLRPDSMGTSHDNATIYLLYSPNAASENPSGLASDVLVASSTYLLRTNLSTLTHSGGNKVMLQATAEPAEINAADLTDPAAFIALLWEASITRSGGFYLNYGGGTGTTPLPETLFASGNTATLSLLVLLDSQCNTRDATMLPFNNCAVVTDNIDTTVASVFVQPATYTVRSGDSLTTAVEAFNQTWLTNYGIIDAAQFNATVPLLLETGAIINVPNSTHEIAYGETLADIAAQYNIDVAALANLNADTPILAEGAQMQFAEGVLRPQAIVSPGTTGFAITRPNPDPDDLPHDQLTPAQLLGTLFNLVGWALAESETFLPSGAGLPTTPADSLAGSDGLSEEDADTLSADWYYSQAIVVAPFAKQQVGSTSPALPAASANPYNGVGSSIAIDLEFQDIYGNILPFGMGNTPVTSPVGYFDDVIGLASWPSIAVGYTVTSEANAPVLALELSMQQTRYIPSVSVPVDAAQAAIAADLASFTTIVYQLADPDLTFELRTTLDADSLSPTPSTPPKYELDRAAFARYASGAFVYLHALSTMAPVTVDGQDGRISDIADAYGVTVAQLLNANQDLNCIELFGDATLDVPVIYSTVAGDSLASIATKQGSDSGNIAAENASVPLNPAAELASTKRTFAPSRDDSLVSAAAAAHTSATALALANADVPGLLAAGVQFGAGTAVYTTGDNDSFNDIAAKLNVTVGEVASANQWQTGVFNGSALTVNTIVPAATDTLESLASRYTNGNIGALIGGNENVQNLWPVAASIQVGSFAAMPFESDTIASFAAENHVTVDQLAFANADLALVGEAVVPAVFAYAGAPQYCTYAAAPTDTIDSIAVLFDSTPAELQELNPDKPDSSGMWICPSMRGDAFGRNTDLTLEGLAQAFKVDVIALATANAASLGLFNRDIVLPLGSPALTTRSTDTFNAIVNRLAQQGTTMTVAEVATSLKGVKGLIAGASIVLPVPPPSPVIEHTITPKFTDQVFALAVSVVITRDASKIDPDFATNPTVTAVASLISPEPDSEGSLSFTHFATMLQDALPGLQVATGGASPETGGASTFWCVNFGHAAGPMLEYTFRGVDANYFAIPPLSTALFGGTVPIMPYVSGTGLSGDAQSQTFQNIDLDVWFNTFTQAIDLFLGPAFAVPAFHVMQGDTRAVEQVIENKRALAQVFSDRMLAILTEKTTGSIDDARAAMYQALLTQLNAAYQVDAVVQVPVTVESGGPSTLESPRLSGRLTGSGGDMAGTHPDAFSFSTAKVSLTEGEATASFLFTVKSPADHRSAQLTLEYAITEMELPDPGMAIGDYEGSSWLQFIGPLETEQLGELDIPVPLRAYPGPTSVVTQVARQSVAAPASAADLLGWDFGFVYQHASAEQDTPMIAIGFNGEPASPMAPPQSETLTPVFNALAQFISVYPALRDDLALLAQQTELSPETEAAVRTFAQLVQMVADAFIPRAALRAFRLVPETYAYQLHKDQDAAGNLTQLVVTSVDIATGQPQPPDRNPEKVAIWPTGISASYPDPNAENGRTTVQLVPGQQRETAITFLYPESPAIPADTPVEHRFVFAWPNGSQDGYNDVWPATGSGFAQPQTIVFTGVNPLARQNAMAGAAVTRNQALVAGFTTNNAFVYRTPLTRFTSSAMPLVTADSPITIGAAPTPVAQALGEFLQQLFTTHNSWSPDDTIYVRVGAGYTYPIAGGPGDTDDTGLDVVVPVLLVPGVDFNPTTDWDWTRPDSIVRQIQAAIDGWRADQSLPPGGSYTFDLTVYAEAGLLQPLIQVKSLRYSLG